MTSPLLIQVLFVFISPGDMGVIKNVALMVLKNKL